MINLSLANVGKSYNFVKKDKTHNILISHFPFRNNKNITLTLSWNVIPNAGALPKILGSGNHQFEFPDEYTTSRF